MAESRSRFQSILSAGVLAALTLTVFGFAQSSGPESAVRRFHQAVREQRWRDVQALLTTPIMEPTASQLVQYVSLNLRNSSSVELRRIQIRNRVGEVYAVYRGPNGGFASLPFVVVRSADGWRVDPEMTRERFSQLVGQ